MKEIFLPIMKKKTNMSLVMKITTQMNIRSKKITIVKQYLL